MTEAPRSARIIPANGPARKPVRSTIFTSPSRLAPVPRPASGGGPAGGVLASSSCVMVVGPIRWPWGLHRARGGPSNEGHVGAGGPEYGADLLPHLEPIDGPVELAVHPRAIVELHVSDRVRDLVPEGRIQGPVVHAVAEQGAAGSEPAPGAGVALALRADGGRRPAEVAAGIAPLRAYLAGLRPLPERGGLGV